MSSVHVFVKTGPFQQRIVPEGLRYLDAVYLSRGIVFLVHGLGNICSSWINVICVRRNAE